MDQDNEQRPLAHLSDADVRIALHAMHGHRRTDGAADHAVSATSLRTIFDSARTAAGATMHIAPGFDSGPIIKRAPVASGIIDLTRALTAASVDDGVVAVNLIRNAELNIDPMAIAREQSRVVSFGGSRLIVAADKPRPVYTPESGMNNPGFYKDVGRLVHVSPAALASTADGANAAVSALPIATADFEWADAPSFSFNTTIERSQRHDLGGDRLEDYVMLAIAMGVGELLDRLFMADVVAANPQPFTIGALAARHAKLDEAKALVGTSGSGAAFRGDGVFSVSGIPAELTATSASTVVGLFNRAAVALRPELMVHVKRMGLDGSSQLTIFGNAQAVIPSAAADFWTVSAS